MTNFISRFVSNSQSQLLIGISRLIRIWLNGHFVLIKMFLLSLSSSRRHLISCEPVTFEYRVMPQNPEVAKTFDCFKTTKLSSWQGKHQSSQWLRLVPSCLFWASRHSKKCAFSSWVLTIENNPMLRKYCFIYWF